MTDRRSGRLAKTRKESRPSVDPALICGEGPGFGLSSGRGAAGRYSAPNTYGVKASIPGPIHCLFSGKIDILEKSRIFNWLRNFCEV